MTALTGDKYLTPESEQSLYYPEPPLTVAASTTIYMGAVVALNTSGFVVNGSADTTLKILGISRGRVDNASGSDGDFKVPISRLPHRLVNSAGADAITAADVGQLCYLVDNQTVARTSAGGDRPIAGRVKHVDSTAGVLVAFHEDASEGEALPILQATVVEADLTDADTSEAVTLGQLEPGFYVLERYLDEVFAGGGNTAFDVIVGTTGNDDVAMATSSVFTGATIDSWIPCVGDGAAMGFTIEAQGNLIATFTSTTGTVAGATTGSIIFRVRRVRT